MPRIYNHTEVKTLPENAVTVMEYATKRGVHWSLIYHEIKRNKANFKVVMFHGRNFIIPEL